MRVLLTLACWVLRNCNARLTALPRADRDCAVPTRGFIRTHIRAHGYQPYGELTENRVPVDGTLELEQLET